MNSYLRVLLTVLCLFGQSAWAGNDLTKLDTRLVPEASWLAGASPQMSVEQALNNTAWQSVKLPYQLSPSFSNQARHFTNWLRFELSNPSNETIETWLALGSTRVEGLEIYVFDQSRQLVKHGRAGSLYPVQTQDIPSPLFRVFSLSNQPHQSLTVLVKVSTTTHSIELQAELWEPLGFREYEQPRVLRMVVALTIMLSVGVYLLAVALVRKDWVQLLISAVLICLSLYKMAYYGYMQFFFLKAGGPVMAVLPLVFALLCVSCMYSFFYLTLNVRNSRSWGNVLLALIVYNLALIPLIWLVGLNMVILLSHLVFLPGLLFVLILLVRFWKQRQPHTTAFNLAGLMFALLIIYRMLEILGYIDLPPVLWSLILGVATFFLLVGFSMRSAANYRLHIRMQEQLIETQKAQQLHLEELVAERTERLQQSLVLAEEANRVKDDFLARVSHDLRSPLTSILGYAQWIGRDASLATAKNARIIIESGQRLLELVNDLIDYASGGRHADQLRVYPTYTYSFLDLIANEAKQLASIQQNNFSMTLADNIPRLVEMDDKRLCQVLNNLLANACKFTYNGQVELAVSYHPVNESRGVFCFRITDTGPGMQAEELEHVFEPFRRLGVKDSTEGVGLGLAIAKHWADKMQARLEVSSSPGAGTEFCLQLTLDSLDETESVPSAVLTDSSTWLQVCGQGLRVWLVEDTDHILHLLHHELESLGFTVDCFACGEQAMLAIKDSASTAPDLLLTDYHLPGYNGRQLAVEARKRWSGLPVFLLSAGYKDVLQPDPLFMAMLLKPIDLGLLRHHLGTLFSYQEGQPESAEVPACARREVLPLVTREQLRHALTDSEHAEYSRLVSIHSISGLLDWSRTLASQRPELSGLLQEISQLALALKIEQLKELV